MPPTAAVREAIVMADAAQVYRDRPMEAEIADVLSQRLVATIGTVNPDGSVHLAYVIFELRDGRIYFETSSLTRKGSEAHEVNHRLRAKYIRPEALPGVDRAWGTLDDVAVEITPRRQRSWTGSALHEHTQGELSMPYGEIWLADG